LGYRLPQNRPKKWLISVALHGFVEVWYVDNVDPQWPLNCENQFPLKSKTADAIQINIFLALPWTLWSQDRAGQ